MSSPPPSGHHTFKFGGDVNIVHEVMINLFQGGGIYSYGGTTTPPTSSRWIQDAFAGQPGDTDPFAGYHYTTFVQTIDVVNTAAGTQGKDDFWMKMFDGFAEDTWKITPELHPHRRRSLRHPAHAATRACVNNQLRARSPPSTAAPSRTSPTASSPVSASAGSPITGTVVRGGYGLFSALNQGSTYYADRVENGVVQINYNYTGCEVPSARRHRSRCATVPSAAQLAAVSPTCPSRHRARRSPARCIPPAERAPTVNGPATHRRPELPRSRPQLRSALRA